METQYNGFEISDEKSRLQIDAIHNWLKDAYWCKGIPKKVISASIDKSLCFGIYKNDHQVGYARVVTDEATFAWLCDVFIDPNCRGQNLSKELMKFILKHPALQSLRRICLGTKDAHKLYEQFGFKVTENPQAWMEIKDNEIYLRSQNG